VLHDAGTTFAANHAAIDRMVAIALDVTDLTVRNVDVDPAPAGAHVTRGLADFVGDRR
jgi:hypothetical protein